MWQTILTDEYLRFDDALCLSCHYQQIYDVHLCHENTPVMQI